MNPGPIQAEQSRQPLSSAVAGSPSSAVTQQTMTKAPLSLSNAAVAAALGRGRSSKGVPDEKDDELDFWKFQWEFWKGWGQGAAEFGRGLGHAAAHITDTEYLMRQAIGKAYERDGLLGAVNEFNPAYHMMIAGSAYWAAAISGNPREAGRQAFQVVSSAASMLMVGAGGGAGGASTGIAEGRRISLNLPTLVTNEASGAGALAMELRPAISVPIPAMAAPSVSSASLASGILMMTGQGRGGPPQGSGGASQSSAASRSSTARPRHIEFGKLEDGYEADRIFSKWIKSPMPDEAWKLHVSADAASAEAIQADLLPKLRELKINHKVVSTIDELSELTGTEKGKFITIYPDDLAHAKSIVPVLDKLLDGRGLKGPVITYDKPLGTSGLVYTRYGSFNPLDLIRNRGSGRPKWLKDNRERVHPPWVQDPWPEPPKGKK